MGQVDHTKVTERQWEAASLAAFRLRRWAAGFTALVPVSVYWEATLDVAAILTHEKATPTAECGSGLPS